MPDSFIYYKLESEQKLSLRGNCVNDIYSAKGGGGTAGFTFWWFGSDAQRRIFRVKCVHHKILDLVYDGSAAK